MISRLTIIALLAASAFAPAISQAAIVMNLEEYTLVSGLTKRMTLSFSGYFDEDVSGNDKSVIGINQDWLVNIGTHTDWYTGFPSVNGNTIKINGVAPIPPYVMDSPDIFSDSVYLDFIFEIKANMDISGSITLYGNFIPEDDLKLELLAGFNTVDNNWAGRVAVLQTVPEPAHAAGLLGFGALALMAWRRRK